MGLRLFWEVDDVPLLRFGSVRALSRHHSLHLAQNRQNIQNNGHNVFEAKPMEATAGLPAMSFVQRLRFDRSKQEFFNGIHIMLTGSQTAAAEIFRTVVTRDDTMADAYFALALLTDNAQEQLQSLDRALVQRKYFTRMFKEADLAMCATITGCDQKELSLMSDFPGLELMAAEVFQNHGKLEYARRLLDQSEHAELDIFCFSRGEVLFRLQRYEETIQVLRKLIANVHLAGPAFYLMGLALEKLGYITTAVQVYRGCLKSERISLRLEAALRRQLAQLLKKEGKEWLAQREYERLVALETVIAEEAKK